MRYHSAANIKDAVKIDHMTDMPTEAICYECASVIAVKYFKSDYTPAANDLVEMPNGTQGVVFYDCDKDLVVVWEDEEWDYHSSVNWKGVKCIGTDNRFEGEDVDKVKYDLKKYFDSK